MKKKQAEQQLAVTEVLSPIAIDARARIAKLVEQKVNEALSSISSDSTFEPFFQPKSVANRMKGTLSVSQQQKFAAYFERWGCLRCDTKKTGHRSLGMCQRCHQLIYTRLLACIGELDAERPMAMPTIDRMDLAQRAILDVLKASGRES